MRIIGQITTFNSEGVLDRSLGALLEQTRPLDEILIVDNASTDDTLRRKFPSQVTVVSHSENRGISGAVVTGFRYALEHAYDWIWLLDSDSAPQPDALERLLELKDSFAPDARISFLACVALNYPDLAPLPGARFTNSGAEVASPVNNQPYYPCDVTIWSGSLYRLATIREIGLPNSDYMLDWGEFAYGLLCRRNGYTGYIDSRSKMHHNIEGTSSRTSRCHLGPFMLAFIESPPFRCYYLVRNVTFFWFHEFQPLGARLVLRKAARLFILVVQLGIAPIPRRRALVACLRGLRDGILGRMDRRY